MKREERVTEGNTNTPKQPFEGPPIANEQRNDAKGLLQWYTCPY